MKEKCITTIIKLTENYLHLADNNEYRFLGSLFQSSHLDSSSHEHNM